MVKVHRMRRHNWWRNHPKEITVRDHQAMYNFAAPPNNRSVEVIAQHFCCSVEYVKDIVVHRPWLLSKNNAPDWSTPAKGGTWWESDHSDPLELVKLFYPQYLPDGVSTEIRSKEKQEEVTWEEYLDTVDWDEVYRNGEGAIEAIEERAKELAEKGGIRLTFKE